MKTMPKLLMTAGTPVMALVFVLALIGCKFEPEASIDDGPGKAAAPAANPAAGAVASGTEIILTSATADAVIYYTVDGSVPSTASASYSAPIEITGAVTIKAIAVKSGMADSDVLTAKYTIDTTLVDAETPVITTPPQDAVYPKGAAATDLSVEAEVSDGGTLSYQWYSNTEDNNTGGTAITGATAKSYKPPTADVGTVYYYVVVTNTITGNKTAAESSSVAKIEVKEPTGESAEAPLIEKITPGVNISTEAWWTTISDQIQKKAKYVILDLSACSGSSIGSIHDKIASNEYIKGIILPSTLTMIEEDAFLDCTYLTSVTIPNSVTSIKGRAFSGCTGLSSVTIPNSITTIEYSVFENCSSLTSVDIPNGVTSIEERAFSGCTGLTSVTIPNGVTSIEMAAFYGCTGLSSVTIPNSITTIKYSVFENCIGFTSVDIPNSVTSIEERAFYDCTGLSSVTIPNGVTSIERFVFGNCSSLSSVAIPDSVTNIKMDAFSGCTGLTSVTIPNSVTSIGENAFSGCANLLSVTIPNLITTIKYSVFKNCLSLTSVAIPDSITNIEMDAFSGCTGLSSVTIPKSITGIDSHAFSGCTGLTSVTFATGSRIPDDNFGNSVFPPEDDEDDSLRTAYLAAGDGAGTYTRTINGNTWSKQ